jgi:hypothetical protein
LTGFKLRSEITDVQVIAVGRAIRKLAYLEKLYGKGRWRKLKGRALVEVPGGRVAQAEVHWYEAHGIGRVDMKIGASRLTMARRKGRFLLCIRRGSYKFSLQPRKIYRSLEDPRAEADGLVRVIDESGEDYLFPAGMFVPIELPAKAAPAFRESTQSR